MSGKYEISIWEDILSEDGKTFREQKLIIIGSDTMTSESRAREPRLVNNINGTNKFTFNMYYSYIDTRTGEKVKNPYIRYLVNERKIKVFWKDKWYDLLIKQIKEDQVNHIFTYTCEDAYITELSRTGFELQFNTELENNIGTAQELVEKVIENTDWRFNAEQSDAIYQLTEEAVYKTHALRNFEIARDVVLQGESPTEIVQAGEPLLVFYSCVPDIENRKNDIQIYYAGEALETDINDMLVINGTSYSISVTWITEGKIAVARIDNEPIFSIDFSEGVSKQYRAKRYVQSQKTEYNNIVERYVNVYTHGEDKIYGYQTTEFNDALAVINLVTNPSNFSNVSGWIGDELYFKLSPTFNKDTVVTEYKATSYLYLKEGTFFNTGIQNNRSYIPNGFIIGEEYIFRIKARDYGTEPVEQSYITSSSVFKPFINSRDPNYKPTDDEYFKCDEEHIQVIEDKDNSYWIEYPMICTKSCPYDMILSSAHPFGIFLQIQGRAAVWLEEVQFFKVIIGLDREGKEVRIDPGKMSCQSVAQSVWKYFNAEQESGITKDTLEYLYTSTVPWSEAIPVTNNFMRYGTIEADNSNRFNILQSIAEVFECWVRFDIHHDEKGNICYDNDGAPEKYIYLKREAGQETGIGFIYGIDLKSIIRNIKSDKISTKTIVEQNENEFGKNGFCSIARSEQNYPRENFIYNFDYYIQQKLLDKDVLYNDLYVTFGIDKNEEPLPGYYTQLHEANIEYANNLDAILNKKTELTKQSAMLKVYDQYISASIEERLNVEDSLMKLASTTDVDEALEYAKTHSNFTKVQALVNDRSTIITTIETYQELQREVQTSVDSLNAFLKKTQARQDEIIDELLDLNKQFYSKYSRYIQEGTWTSEDYWNDDLYYLDAVQVAYTSSRPQISYEINVLRLSDIPEYASKKFYLGDISFIQDVEYFGYKDQFTPYKEKVILTEITSYFDTPDKDIIKVQNYKTQFDDLFQRITAAVQKLEFTQGKYAKVADIIREDGTIRSNIIQNTFNENIDLVYGAQNESATIDNTGITVTSNADGAKQVKVTSGGIFITDDGGQTWRNAIRGDGITADAVTTGKLNTEVVTIYGQDAPSFTWDQYGINAYMLDQGGAIDTVYEKAENVTAENFADGIYYILENDEYILATEFEEKQKYYTPVQVTKYDQFVRFDKYGIYGIKGKENYRPNSERQIYQDANFGLTWNKFFMKSQNNGKFIEISTDRDIVVNDGHTDRIVIGRVDGINNSNYGIRVKRYDEELQEEQVIFECSDNGSQLSGWTLTKDCLMSTATSEGQAIKIYADGNIGCYAQDATQRIEQAYVIQTQNSFDAIGLNTDDITIGSGSIIYPFISSIGKTKTQRQVSGEVDVQYLTPSEEYIPTPPKKIYFVYNNGSKEQNYYIEENEDSGWDWQIELNKCETNTITIDKSVYTTYIYTFDVFITKDGQTLFEILYSNEPTITQKERFLPASDTKWYIDNNGDAIFHEILADGGKIAGWFIDNEKIYQTTNGEPDGPIKTQLNSTGTANKDGFDYSIITDAINAAMANIGGVLMSGGLINGYNIAAVAAMAADAANTAYGAQSIAYAAQNTATSAYNLAAHHQHRVSVAVSATDGNGEKCTINRDWYYTTYTNR